MYGVNGWFRLVYSYDDEASLDHETTVVGLLYERDDERTEPPGANAYRVTIMTRGVLQERDDPFFSPSVPVIEPPEQAH